MKHAINLNIPEPTTVTTHADAQELCRLLMHEPLISIDTETTGLDIARDTVVFWSLASNLHERFFLTAEVLEDFDSLFSNKYVSWVGSQVKYDAHILANSGYPLAGGLLCTLTMDRLVDPSQPHGLKEVYTSLFTEYMRSFALTFYPVDGKGKPRKPPKMEMYQILKDAYAKDPDKVIDYASKDAWGALRVFYALRDRLKQIYTKYGYTLWHIFIHYESAMTRTLYEMERAGAPADEAYIRACRPALEEKMTELSRELNKRVGRVINISSPKQLGDYFFNIAGYTPSGKTTTGQFKVDKQTYKSLEDQGCEEAGIVAHYAKLSKVLGTYVDGMLSHIVAGLIHTNLNQHRAETARLSSSDPNLQNAQKKAGEFIDIRKIFIAPFGEVLLVGDYDQLEMYVLGDYSQDANLLRAIAAGKDIHCANVETIYEVPYDEVLAAKVKKETGAPLSERELFLLDLRDAIKTIGFGQPNSQAEVKPAQNDEIRGLRTTTCCASRRSVSTCGAVSRPPQ